MIGKVIGERRLLRSLLHSSSYCLLGRCFHSGLLQNFRATPFSTQLATARSLQHPLKLHEKQIQRSFTRTDSIKSTSLSEMI